jgi:tRNA (cmo5U34)-methyltransferase
MAPSDSTPKDFYDNISGDYNAAIERCVPRYREMLWAILRYIPDDLNPRSILELGCGGGNLTDLLLQRYPKASIHCVDLSEEMIEQCRQRLRSENVSFERTDFREIRLAPETFDLVVSSISIHHLDDPAKKLLFRTIHDALAPEGVFVYSDQFAGATEEVYRKHIEEWKEAAIRQGTTAEEWDAWMKHQDEHDHHAPVVDQMSWLKGCGFKTVDCSWRYLLWAVVSAAK